MIYNFYDIAATIEAANITAYDAMKEHITQSSVHGPVTIKWQREGFSVEQEIVLQNENEVADWFRVFEV